VVKIEIIIDMDNKNRNMYGQKLSDVYNKNYQEFEDRVLRVYNHLLASSVSLQALLLPLGIYLKTSGYATHLLSWAGVSLLLCSATTVSGLFLVGAESLKRKKHAQNCLEYLKGLGPLPTTEYKPHHVSLLVVAIVSAICFLLAAGLLFVSLFQMLYT
jgi:hypothetical protein